jgi:ribonuclease J
MDEHKKVKISAGDTVIISATPIPGNEDLVMRTINRLFRLGADVVYDLIKPVHVSGHGNQEDLKLMINLVKPKYIVPIHGEFRHFAKFIQLAEVMGYDRENIIRVDIGDVIVTDGETVKIEGKIEPVGSVMVDGLGVGDVSDIELRDRRHLASDGIIIIVAGIDQTTGEITVGPDVMSRGFVVEEHTEELMEEARALVVEQISNMDMEEITEWSAVKADVRKAVAKFLYDRTRRRPMVVPIIMEL